MLFRALVASAALLSPVVALAQDYSPPPMLSSDGEEEAPAIHEFGPGEYPPYTNAPIDEARHGDEHYEGDAPAPESTTTFAGSFFESTREKHFLALVSGSVGVFAPGLMFNVRAEADIGKLGLLASYSGFGFGEEDSSQGVDHFMAMGGWSIFSREEITWRVLGGLDIIGGNGMVATGPVFGTNLRAMAGSLGFDAAAFLTPFPFRQLELRAAFVVRFWSIFEAHAGWRFQAIDATPNGTFDTLFSQAPSLNGPVIGMGMTF